MLRITVVEQTKEEVVLKVEGWVADRYVEVLAAEGERVLGQAGRLVLDLAGVRFIDEGRIQVLRRWAGERLELRGASRFITALLKAHGVM